MSIANCFHHPPCHSAIRHRSNFSIPSRWQAQHNVFDQPPHLIPPSATSFRHPPPHSAICHPIPNCFHHPPRHSSHRPSRPILILSRWQAQHITLISLPTSFRHPSQVFSANFSILSR